MIPLYRLEHFKDKLGPYNHIDLVRNKAFKQHDKEGHTQHHKCTIDFEGLIKSDYFFGCKTIEDLTFYFGMDALEHAISIGYQIVEYMVPKQSLLEGDGEVAVFKFFLDDFHRKVVEATEFEESIIVSGGSDNVIEKQFREVFNLKTLT